MENNWKTLNLHEGAELFRKEQFLYHIADQDYTIELFESIKGEYYAIGLPANSDKLMIYGSSIVNDPVKALQQTLRKIDRDAENLDIHQIGEDVRHDFDEVEE